MNAKNTSSFEHEFPELEKRENSESMQKSFTKPPQKSTPTKAIFIAIGIIVILFLLWLFLHRSSTESDSSSPFSSSLESDMSVSKESTEVFNDKVKEPSIVLPESLSIIEQNYLKLQEELNRKEERIRVLETDGRLALLQNEVEQLKRIDESALKAEILKQVDRRFSVIEGKLSKLKEEQSASLSELPFKVVAIDLWDGRPYVAVFVDSKTKLVGVGDTVMGWQVSDIQFQQQRVVFKKDGKQKEVMVQ